MAEQVYIYTALSAISCDNCRQLAAGDQVDIALRTDLLPALPDDIRGIVQLVNGLDYTIQYDDADLLGVIAELTDEFVDTVACVTELTLAKEHSDAKDAEQDAAITAIQEALIALGVVPSDGDNQFVVHPDSEAGVSVESLRHDKLTVAKDGGSDAIILDPVDLVSPLAILDLTDKAYRLEVVISAISVEKPTNNRDSMAEYLLVGEYNKGTTLSIIHQDLKDGVSISAASIGNNLHINLNNPSSGDITMFVTSKIRVLS